MGNKQSNVATAYDKSADPCSIYLDTYLACVEKKKGGLREGDECEEQNKDYKLCRFNQKKLKAGPK